MRSTCRACLPALLFPPLPSHCNLTSRHISIDTHHDTTMDSYRRPPSTSRTTASTSRGVTASYNTTGTGYRHSTSNPLASTSNPFYTTNGYTTATGSRPRTARPSTGRPGTARPRTGISTIMGVENQEIICAVSESRGVSPSVGLAFLNLDTGEAVLSQFSDSQTYVRTIHKVRACQSYPASLIDPCSSVSSTQPRSSWCHPQLARNRNCSPSWKMLHKTSSEAT